MSLNGQETDASSQRQVVAVTTQLLALVEGLKKEVSSLKSTVSHLKETVLDNVKQVEELKKEVSSLNCDIDKIKESSEKNAEKAIAGKLNMMENVVAKLKTGNQLQVYEETEDWQEVGLSLEAVLDSNSKAYKQLQAISPDDTTPFFSVGHHGYIELAQVLLGVGRGPDMADANGNTMLHGAAAGGHVKLAKLLLDQGACCDRKNKYGNTAMINGAKENKIEMVKFLKANGASVNSAGENGWTSLHWAVSRNLVNMVRCLVEIGADITAKDFMNKTPVDHVSKGWSEALERYFLQLQTSSHQGHEDCSVLGQK